MVAYVLLRVFVILLLVAANAFFAAAEFALVSVRETRIQQLIEAHRVGARTVLKLHQQLSRVVNGVQLGITVTSLTLAGWASRFWRDCLKAGSEASRMPRSMLMPPP